MRARVASAVLAIAIAAVAAAQPQPVDATIRAVRQLIDAGRPSEALTTLQAADLSAASKRDRARILFYTARVHEELGDEAKAIAAYGSATEIEPTYGAAMNNLGQLLLRRGDSAAAAALLRKAAALDDPHRLLYLNNYAVAAEKAGDVEAARNAFGQLAAAQPDNVAAQTNAIRLLDDPKRIADLLAKLTKFGEVSAAQSLALDLLRKPFDERAKRSFLSVVAGTLASQQFDPSQFDALPVASRIAALREDPNIRDGVTELLLLCHGNADPAQYRWWRAGQRDERFAALINGIGANRVASNDKKQAESYFKLAIDYSNGADPEAFVELADLYYSQQRIADLDALMHEYEAPMFAAKGAVIAARDYATEYRFHVALGTMYAYLGRWGSEQEPASAIFQLTQAQRAASDHNRTITWGTKIPIDPKTIELLATGYTQTHMTDRAVALRIDSADAFLDDGRKTAATQLLKPFRKDPPVIADPAYRKRYDTVIEKSKAPMVKEFVIGFPDATSVDLTSMEPIPGKIPQALGKQIVAALANYVTGESEETQEQAERTLTLLGVTGLDPTTMSRTTGELLIPVDGKPVRYRYVVRASQ